MITVLALLGGLVSVVAAASSPAAETQQQQLPFKVFLPGLAGDSASGSSSPSVTASTSPGGTQTRTSTATTTSTTTSTGTTTITATPFPTIIVPQFSPPMAVDDAYSMTEDAVLNIPAPGVLANDSGSPPPTASAQSGPANGTLLLNPNGNFTYTPNPNFNGTDEFFYTANNIIGPPSVGKVTITVQSVSDAPVAVPDLASTTQDTSVAIDVLANDTDADGGPKSVASVTDPVNGSVLITGGGTSVTYTPDPGYCNTPPGTTLDTFSYTLSPGSSSALVTVTVICETPPLAVDDTATVGEDTPAAAIDVLANDTDADGGPKNIASATQPSNGTVALTGGSPGAHTGLTYQPDLNYCNSVSGIPDTFTYTLTPGSSSATVSLTVTCADDPPSAVNDSATVGEDAAAATIPVLANDSDSEGDAFSIASASDPANGTVVLTGGSPGAHTGLTYQPDPDYCNNVSGIPDTFTYSLNPAGSTATVSVTVTCADDPPTAVNDSASVGEDAGATAVLVLANDLNADGGPIAIASASDPANGTVVLTGGTLGNHTGLTYQPDPNYCNAPPSTTPDTFTYTLTQGGSTAIASMTVNCADDPPVAVDDTANTVDDSGPIAIDVLANDTDIDGGPIWIASASDPAKGTVVLTGGSPGAHTGLTYQPDPGYCDDVVPDTFTYSLNPGGDAAIVSVTVNCDVPPVASPDSATVGEDSGANAVAVLANDNDGGDGGPVLVQSVSQPANGSVSITGGGTGVTYQPNANHCNNPPGTAPDTFTYTLNGGSTAIVSVTVTCVDDVPTAVDDSGTVNEDSAATAVDVLTNDTDIDAGPKTVTSATQPANGAVVITGGGTGLTYQPSANYCNDGNLLDTFTYTLNGGSTATVSMTVTCIADSATAVADGAIVGEDSAATPIAVLANDLDPDSAGLAIMSATDPANGTVVLTGGSPGAHTGLTYQPDLNYCGIDTFDYTLSPGGSVGTVSVTVTCVNDAPSFTKGADQTVAEDAGAQSVPGWATAIGKGAANESGQTVNFFVTNNSNAALFSAAPAVSPTGTLTYTPAADRHGTATITVKLTDDGGSANGGVNESATQDFVITVTPVNDAPTAVAQGYNAQANMKIAITTAGLLTGAGDSADTAGNAGWVPTLTVSNVSATTPAGGVISNLNTATGTFEFEPPPGVTGPVTFTYQVCDNGEGLPASECSAPATVTFTVSGPVIWFVDDSASATGANGTLAHPFTNLAAAAAVDAANHRIFLFSGTYTTGIALNSGEWLFGEAATTGAGSFDTQMGITPPVGTIIRPTLGGSAVTVSGTVTLETNTLLKGIALSTGASTALNDPAGAINGVSVTETSITTSTGSGVVLSSAVGTFNFTSLTTAGGAGASLSGTNTGATFAFAGVTISSAANGGFESTGGGTLTITGAANTIASTTGTALNVTGTTIGAGGLNFRSISANGAPNGIILNNTGATAGLTVTGDGNTSQGGNNSGGTIQSTTGDGISLTSTRNVSLNNMNLQSTLGHGINGTGVNTFSFTNGKINNVGDASDESCVSFDNLNAANVTGTFTFNNNQCTLTEANGVDIENYGATLASVSISGNLFTDTGDVATPGSAVLLISNSTAGVAGVVTTASLTNNTITDFRAGAGFVLQANTGEGFPGATYGTANTANAITVTGNLMNGGNGGIGNQPDRFITGALNGSGTANFIVSNNGTAGNPIQKIDGVGIELSNFGAGTMSATVNGNFLAANNAVGSAGIGVGCDADGFAATTDNGTLTLVIDGNNVSQTDGPGIFAIARGSSCTLNVRITNNTVAAPFTTGSARAGIRVDSGSAVGDTNLCLDLRGNTTAGSTNTGTGTTSPGINLRKQGTDPNVNTFGIEGMAATASPNVENYVNGLNTSTSGTFGVGGTALLSATTGFTSCSSAP